MAAAQVPRAPVPALRSRDRAASARALAALLALALPLAIVAASCRRADRAWPDGAPRFEGRLDLSGKRDGEWSFHYPDGSLRERGRYEGGRRVGVWRQWHRGGELATEGERRWNAATGASEREGPWIFRDADGTLRARGVFRAGQREGDWEFFDEDGLPTETPPWAREDASAEADDV